VLASECGKWRKKFVYSVVFCGQTGCWIGENGVQLRLWTAAIIFTGSYFPLSLILLVQDFNSKLFLAPLCLPIWDGESGCVVPFTHAEISGSIFVACLLSLAATLYLFKLTKVKRKIKVLQVKYVPSELMNYTLPYVVSFMGISYSEENKFFGMIIFLFWIFWITYKSGQLIMNPVLVVFGWRLYELTYEHEGDSHPQQGLVLSNGELSVGEFVNYGQIQEVTVVKKQMGISGG
jgi:hypothetical protein